MIGEPRYERVPPSDIYIDQDIMIAAGYDPQQRARWTVWAREQLAACTARPIVSDRGATRGPNGERYALLGFHGLAYDGRDMFSDTP